MESARQKEVTSRSSERRQKQTRREKRRRLRRARTLKRLESEIKLPTSLVEDLKMTNLAVRKRRMKMMMSRQSLKTCLMRAAASTARE